MLQSTKSSLKHCHFSILCNELPFLKQKLPFLYRHFDQLIFYDLNVANKKISSDGSNKYIRNFPDPDKKLLLLQGVAPIKNIKKYHGQSFVEKQKMFAAGSKHVRKDINVFWCTDMDEFFQENLIREVEKKLTQNPKIKIINVPHVVFFKSLKYAMFDPKSKHVHKAFMFRSAPRIVRHVPGTIYGHCPVLPGPQYDIGSHCIYHFSWVGFPRVLQKMIWYKNLQRLKSYIEKKFIAYKGGLMQHAHPNSNPKFPVSRLAVDNWRGELPAYIDAAKLEGELSKTTDSNLKRIAKEMFNINLK